MAAKGATLTFMVGGPTDKFEEAKEILSLMGKNVVHCGAVSTGQVICASSLWLVNLESYPISIYISMISNMWLGLVAHSLIRLVKALL